MSAARARMQRALDEFSKCENNPDAVVLTKEFTKEMCFRAREMLLREPVKLELEPPLVVVGDVHGQFRDVKAIFEEHGYPDRDKNSNIYLFLGDYVDRGPHSIELITYLILIKMLYPKNIYLLRGNHECRYVNQIYGFYNSVAKRFDEEVWDWFNTVFNCLPVCARIGKKIFCMHGGLSKDMYSWEQFEKVYRPCSIPDFGVLCDLVWADPYPDITGFRHSPRGVSFIFGENIVHEFCESFGIDMVIRAHQVVMDGYEFFANRKLVTLFSAANYCGNFDNAGAVLSIDDSLCCSLSVRKPVDHKVTKKELRVPLNELNAMHEKEMVHFSKSMESVYKMTKAKCPGGFGRLKNPSKEDKAEKGRKPTIDDKKEEKNGDNKNEDQEDKEEEGDEDQKPMENSGGQGKGRENEKRRKDADGEKDNAEGRTDSGRENSGKKLKERPNKNANKEEEEDDDSGKDRKKERKSRMYPVKRKSSDHIDEDNDD